MLGLCCCVWIFSSCSEWGLLSSCSAQAFCSSGFSCGRAWALGTWASVGVVHGFSQFSSVMSNSATPWTAARQASLSITNSWSLLKLTSIESVMPSNHLILCHPLLLLPSIFLSIRVFPMSQFFTSGDQNIGASALFLTMNIQD